MKTNYNVLSGNFKIVSAILFFLAAGLTVKAQAPGNAISLNGSSQYVWVADNNALDLTNNFTVEAWIKPNSFNALGGIVTKYNSASSNGFTFTLGGTSPYTSIGFCGQYTATGLLTAGKWYHVAGVVSGGQVTIYIDGVSVKTGTAGPLAANSDPMTIGRDYTPTPRYFNGSFDEVRIWNVARSQDSIRARMYNVAMSNASGLVAYYQCNESTGATTLTSLTGSNNGTVYSSPSFTESYAMVVPPTIAASGILGTKFTANWTAPVVGTVTSYKLDVSTSSTFGTFVSGYSNLDCGTNVSQQVTGLTAGTTYYYRVRADKTSVTGTGANYYTFQTVPVVKANQTITFGALPVKVMGDLPFTVSATASSGLAVTITSENTSLATVSGTTATIVGAGSGNIYVNQAGNTDYNAATQGSQLLSVDGSATWTGNGGTDWNTAANWSALETPVITNDVTIPTGKANYPLVTNSAASPAVCKILAIYGNLAIAPGGALTVNGALYNLSGSPGGLLIQSDATGTGSLLHSSNNVPGTIQRYITGSASLSDMVYHLVSVPLYSASDPTSNLFLGSYLFLFSENNNDWINLGTSTATSLEYRRGYMVYYPGISHTYSFAGMMNGGSGTVNALTNYSGAGKGFNLIPNPYPSAIDWLASGGWNKVNVDNAVYVWNSGTSTSNYASFINGAGTLGGSQYISPGQSFFVHANGNSPSVDMANGVRVHNPVSFLKNNEAIPDLLKIHADAGTASDEIVVRFADGATSGFDGEWDAFKMTGGENAPQLSSVTTDDINLAINSLPLSAEPVTVPLDFTFNASSDVTFTASGIESFNPASGIYLEDKTLNKMVNLRQEPVYTFSYPSGSATDRFILHFNGVTGVQENNASASGRAFISNGRIYLELPSMQGQLANITLYNAIGQVIRSQNQMINGISSIEAPLSTGVYIIHVATASQNFVTKVINK